MDLIYICPSCKKELRQNADGSYHCSNCLINFPTYLDIPDFRIPSQKTIFKNKEANLLKTILKDYKNMRFLDMLNLRINPNNTPSDIYEVHLHHELRARKRGEEVFSKINFILNFLEKSLTQKNYGLDLGCGMGSILFAMSHIFKNAVGVDISLIDLLLAKKRFEEEGINNVKLICGSVEALPFENNTFDLITANDVIEHIENQKQFLKEAYRVLQLNGYFYFNSPNRFNIFGPEPHVNLWGVGFLPRKLMPKYVRLLKGVDYKGKRLLSYFELSHLLRKIYKYNFNVFGIILTDFSSSTSYKAEILKRTPWVAWILNTFLKPFIPQYHVIIQKSSK